MYKKILNKYEINENGDVRNSNTKRILKPFQTKTYTNVCLFINGKKKTYWIHRLVALAFIPNPKNKSQVNHIDGNKKNNHISNLEWVTAKENTHHAIKNNLSKLGGDNQFGGKKRILCNETGIIFESISEASRTMFLQTANIIHVLKGRRDYTKGYSFIYV